MISRVEIYNNKTSHSEYFMAVYEAAKAHDKARLQQLKAEHYSYDTLDSRSLFTPAARLAREGNHAAVMLLIEVGADAGDAAMGAASIGDTEFTEHLRSKYGACLAKIAMGAGMHEDQLYAQFLLQGSRGVVRHVIFGNAVRLSMYGDADAKITLTELTDKARHELEEKLSSDDDDVIDAAQVNYSHNVKYCGIGLVTGLDLQAVETDPRGFLQGDSEAAVFLRSRLADLDAFRDEEIYLNQHEYLFGAATGAAAIGAAELAKALCEIATENNYGDEEAEDLPLDVFSNLVSADNIDFCLQDTMADLVPNLQDRQAIIADQLLITGNHAALLRHLHKLIPEDDINDKEIHQAFLKYKLPVSWVKDAAKRSSNLAILSKLKDDTEFLKQITIEAPHFRFVDHLDILSNAFTYFEKTHFATIIHFLAELIPGIDILSKLLTRKASFFYLINETRTDLSDAHLLHILSFINKKTLDLYLRNALKTKGPQDAIRLFHMAVKIRTIMDKYDFDFLHALEFVTNNDLRRNMSMMIFNREFTQLPIDINIHLLTKMTPLSHAEISAMLVKYRRANQAHFFMTDKRIKLNRQDSKQTPQEMQDAHSLADLHGLFHEKLQRYRLGGRREQKTADAIERHIKRIA